jgi:RNA polymerase sigma-70 factor, ECF subfamily
VTDANVDLNESSGRTSETLLVRVKSNDQEAWRRLVHLYGPLVYAWCRRFGLQEADAADVGQDVFRTVAESIAEFHHDRKGDTFRGWLQTVTRTRVVDFLRKRAHVANGVGGSDAQTTLLRIPDCQAEPGSSIEQTIENEDLLLIRRAADMVLETCKEETRQAFLRVVIAGQHPADVAKDLGLTVNAVYLAKSHILRRIREEFSELVDI